MHAGIRIGPGHAGLMYTQAHLYFVLFDIPVISISLFPIVLSVICRTGCDSVGRRIGSPAMVAVPSLDLISFSPLVKCLLAAPSITLYHVWYPLT